MPWSPGGGLWLKLSLLRSWSADCFMEALNDAAQMTRQELIDMAVKAGFFCDAESATQGILLPPHSASLSQGITVVRAALKSSAGHAAL